MMNRHTFSVCGGGGGGGMCVCVGGGGVRTGGVRRGGRGGNSTIFCFASCLLNRVKP